MYLGCYLSVIKYMSLEDIYKISGLDDESEYGLDSNTYGMMRQAFLLIPLKTLLAYTSNNQEKLSVYAKYYSHLPKQGTEDWRKARSGELLLPLVAGEKELRYVAHADRVEDSTALIDLYMVSLADIYTMVQTGRIKGSVAFGGSEITELAKSHDPASTVKKKFLNDFRGNIHTNWGHLFEDVINEFMDLHLDCKTASFGSIPGMRDADGATIQTYSPDGIAVVKVDQISRVLNMYMGAERMKSHPMYAEFRAWLEKKQASNEKDATILYEFKCPTVRIPDGYVPDSYTLQPQVGATTVSIIEACLFVDTSFRKCTIDDFGFWNNNYDREFHAKDGDQLNNVPLACGFVGVYRIGGVEPEDAMNNLSEMAVQAGAVVDPEFDSESGAVDPEFDSESNAADTEPPTLEYPRAKIVEVITNLIRHDVSRVSENTDPAALRRRVVALAGLVYRYIHVVRVWHPELTGDDVSVTDYMSYGETIREIQERVRRKANYSVYRTNEEVEPEISEEELRNLANEVRVGEYLRATFPKTYREIYHGIIVEVCTAILGDSTKDPKPQDPKLRSFLDAHVSCVIELLDRSAMRPIYDGLIDYGKAHSFEMDRLLRSLFDDRDEEDGIKAYYPKGYYCAKDIYDPRHWLTTKRPENWIDFSVADEARRAKDWLAVETSRFLEFCKTNNAVPVGLLPYKIMKLAIVPMITRNIEDEIRPMLEERAHICNKFRGLDKDEVMRRLNELPSSPSSRGRGRGGRGRGRSSQPSYHLSEQFDQPITEQNGGRETSALDAFMQGVYEDAAM